MPSKLSILIVLFITLSLLSTTNVAMEAASFDVTLTKQTPYPAEPGKVVDIEIEIQNTGKIDAENVIVEVIPKPPFTLLPGEIINKTFSRIAAKSSIKTTYKIQVENNATSNQYELSFRIYTEADKNISYIEKVNINVQGSPDLLIESISLIPESIEPSQSASIVLYIKNVGTGEARKVKVRLKENKNIIPLLSGGLAFVGDIKPGYISSATLEVNINSSADYGTHSIGLEFNYTSENNTPISKSFDIGIPVTGSVIIEMIKIEPNYERNVLKVEIANKGTIEAKSLEAKLIVDNSTAGIDYVSQLKPNKQTILEFPMVYNGTGKLIINYITPGLEAKVIEKDMVFSFQMPRGDNTNIIIAIIIFIIIGAWYWRRKRVRKRL